MQTVDEFCAALDRLPEKAIEAYDAALVKSVPVIKEAIDLNFDSASTSSGRLWPKRKDDKSHPLLDLTGRLRGAATFENSNHYHFINKGHLEWGIVGIPYARVHQEGGGNNIPQREYLAVNEGTVDKMVEIAADELIGVI